MTLVPREHERVVLLSYCAGGLACGLLWPLVDAAAGGWGWTAMVGLLPLICVLLAAYFPRVETVAVGTVAALLLVIPGGICGALLEGGWSGLLRIASGALGASLNILWYGEVLGYGALPILFVSGMAAWVAGRWRRVFEPRAGHCSVCDYPLKGLSVPRCPECGTPVAQSLSAG